MNLFSALQDPAATKMRQAVRLFAEALMELAAEPAAGAGDAGVVAAPSTSFGGPFEHSSPGLRPSGRSTGAPSPAGRVEAPSPAVAGEDPETSAPVIRERAAPIVAAARVRASSSAEKLPLLRQHAGTMPVSELEKVVGLKKSTLYRLAKAHGLQLGTPEHRLKIDLDELRRLAPTTAMPALMERFGCTDGAIRLAAKAHSIALLAQPRPGRAPAVTWTDDMVAVLREKAGKVPAEALAAELGVNRNPLFLKARALDLSLAMAWTPERSAELARLVGTMNSAQLAAHFHVTLYSLADELARQGIGRKAEPKEKRERPARPVAEVPAGIDAVPSTLTEGGWVEGQDEVAAEAPAVEAEATPTTLEGVSYSITTPDRSPPSPELIEALQPVVEAAVKAMRAQAEDAPSTAEQVQQALERSDFEPTVRQPSAAFARFRSKTQSAEEVEADPSSALRAPSPSRGEGDGAGTTADVAATGDRTDRLERLRDEQAGRAMLGFEPLPVERRRAAPRPRGVAVARTGRVEPESKWVRLQHPDGRWLRMDGLGWVAKKEEIGRAHV